MSIFLGHTQVTINRILRELINLQSALEAGLDDSVI